jgi:hypothetical protein
MGKLILNLKCYPNVLWRVCLGPDSSKPTMKGHSGGNQGNLITDWVVVNDTKMLLLILLGGIMALWLRFLKRQYFERFEGEII